MKYYYDGMTPLEEYPIDFDIECYKCKYVLDCYSNNAIHKCLKEQQERDSDDRGQRE